MTRNSFLVENGKAFIGTNYIEVYYGNNEPLQLHEVGNNNFINTNIETLKKIIEKVIKIGN